MSCDLIPRSPNVPTKQIFSQPGEGGGAGQTEEQEQCEEVAEVGQEEQTVGEEEEEVEEEERSGVEGGEGGSSEEEGERSDEEEERERSIVGKEEEEGERSEERAGERSIVEGEEEEEGERSEGEGEEEEGERSEEEEKERSEVKKGDSPAVNQEVLIGDQEPLFTTATPQLYHPRPLHRTRLDTPSSTPYSSHFQNSAWQTLLPSPLSTTRTPTTCSTQLLGDIQPPTPFQHAQFDLLDSLDAPPDDSRVLGESGLLVDLNTPPPSGKQASLLVASPEQHNGVPSSVSRGELEMRVSPLITKHDSSHSKDKIVVFL